MATKSFYPSISNLVTIDDFPAELQFLEIGLQNALNKIYYKELQYVKSGDGSQGYYNIVLVTGEPLKLDFMDTGFSVVINPGSAGETLIPITLNYNWPILRFIKSFNLQSFSYQPEQLQEVMDATMSLSDTSLIQSSIQIFEGGESPASYDSFVDKVNAKYSLSGSSAVLYPVPASSIDMAEEVLFSIITNSVITDSIKEIIDGIYIYSPNNIVYQNNLNQFSAGISSKSIMDYVEEIIIPKIDASLDIAIGLAFPRYLLVPINPVTNEPLPEPEQSILFFGTGSLRYSTQAGIGFEHELAVTLNHPSVIGNTGLGIDIIRAKLDLSQNTNIIEADLDGRPQNFNGIYAEYIGVTLPPRWFNNVDNTTLRIAGYNMLIGTGGVSGTIALEAVNGTPATGDDYLNVNLGNWELGFNYFDITFKQNDIVSSNIRARLTIPNFKKPNGEIAEIDVVGNLESNGDFKLTASTSPPYPIIELGDIFRLHMKSVELGREDGDFFIGASCDLEFLGLLGSFLEGQSISISSLRIYSNGRIEFHVDGGNLTLPKPIKFNLGPVELSVTALHFGSHEREKDGIMRKYNYFGFDGGISVGIAGVDARGDGIKFYYTVDDGPGKAPDRYLHIQTIYVDLVLPANSSDPTVMLNGWLSIPEPGVSKEYSGGISLKLKNPRISGSVSMRLAPRYPAFLIDAGIELPSPIPLGAVSIYGFRGLLGYRYVAEKEAIGMTSQNTWYEYYKAPIRGVGLEKFSGPEQTKDYNNPVSLGVGAIIGDSMALGNIFSANAMLLLSLPSMIMVDARMKLLARRVSFNEDPPFFAFFIIGDNSMEFGFGADYKFPENSGDIIKVFAEIQAGFFFNNPSAWYINLGTEQTPIQASILKNLFSLKAYVMLSGQGIRAGARGEFRFDRSIGGFGIKFVAYMELGGRISFERPQMGGYFEMGVEVGLSLVIVKFSMSISVLLAVESPKPFLVYGRFDIRIKLSIIFVIEINISGSVELKWEFNRQVDRTPVNPMTEAPEVAEGLVKGVSMLTGETFDLVSLRQPDGSININLSEIRKKVVPLDTYVDIRTTKGLLPGDPVNALIGGFTNPPGYFVDLIPPEKVMKGIELRQVKHQYSIESMEIMAHTPNGWQPYNPYKAMYPSDEDELLDTLKAGHWQKKDDMYNAIRLLANNPFSYTEQGEPGWFVPEYFGVDGHTLFCQGTEKEWHMSHFLQKPLGSVYYASNDTFFHSMQASYRVVGTTLYYIEDDNAPVYQGMYGFITDYPNIYAYGQSLAFPKTTPLVIMLSAPSVRAELKLSSNYGNTTIAVYKPLIQDQSEFVQYGLVESRELTPEDLMEPVFFETDVTNAITRIVITPSDAAFSGFGLIGGLSTPGVEAPYLELLSYQEALFFEPYVFIPDDKQPDIKTKEQELCDFIVRNAEEKQYEKITEILYKLRIESKLFDLYRRQFEENLNELHHVIRETYGKFTQPIITRFYQLKSNLKQILEILEPLRETKYEPLSYLTDKLRFQERIVTDERTNEIYSPLLNTFTDFIKEYPEYDFLYPIVNRRLGVLTQIIANGPSAYLHNPIAAAAYNEAAAGIITAVAQVSNLYYSTKTHDLLHEVRWLTLEDYQYNSHIPSQQYITEEVEAVVDSINKFLPPVWRPDTSYYVRFRLKDDVDNGQDSAEYDYAFGFHTAGPVGFFHTDEYSPYGPLSYDQQDQYPHTSLRAYIDYERSYPNADGDLVSAKPLFYNDTTTEVNLFFRHRYAEKLLEGWEAYNGMPALGGTMKLIIKDPVEDVEIVNPPNLETTEESIILSNLPIPQTIEQWVVDEVPLMDNVTGQWFNMLEDGCVYIPDPAKPLSYFRKIELKRLKPQKLYTVQVLNFYWGADTSVDPEHITAQDKDRYARSVHEYVFQTSRYRNFSDQVRSFYRFAEDETTIAQQALYTIEKELDPAVLTAAFTTITGTPNAMSRSIAIQFQHPFDRVGEGLFGLPAMDKAVSTEINRIVDTNTGQVAALLIRSPEPFNNPRFPLEAISRSAQQEGMIEILTEDQSQTDELYHVLYSKDYAQAVIMYDAGYILAEQLHIRFIYRIWNGSTYIVADTQELLHLPIN